MQIRTLNQPKHKGKKNEQGIALKNHTKRIEKAYSMKKNLPSIKILGTDITTASESEVLEYIFKRLEKPTEKFYIVTPNPEILMLAARSKGFQYVLNSATLSLPDGIGVAVAGRILKKQIIGRITGTDLMEKICAVASKRPISIGFLGGSSGVAEKASECLREKYPGLRVVFVGEKWKNEVWGPVSPHPHSSSSPRASLGLQVDNGGFPVELPLTKPHIDILFVAFGAPKQEEWIAKNLPNIDVTVAMGVGGAFDYVSGKVRRAPKVLRSMGMEWAFRLIRQPWRIRRQLALPQFAYAVLKERFS